MNGDDAVLFVLVGLFAAEVVLFVLFVAHSRSVSEEIADNDRVPLFTVTAGRGEMEIEIVVAARCSKDAIDIFETALPDFAIKTVRYLPIERVLTLDGREPE